MRYFVYLTGSKEGTREAGSYPTNEYALLYYNNYLNQPTGQPCQKPTFSPIVAWKAANVSYAFYLVDENGNIIVNQTTGELGSFANKVAVTNPVLFEEILLNNIDIVKSIDVASLDVLPGGYKLYDANAAYTIQIRSDATGSWTIAKSENLVSSTYVTHYDPEDAAAYTNELNKSSDADFTHTIVWFAVVWKVQALPDSVVVDYGLPVDISVLANDMFGENGKLVGVGAYSDSLNLNGHDTTLAAGFGSTYTGKYGTAEANTTTGKVRYTLNSMQMNGYDKFAYAVKYSGSENAGYYYDTVTVIPATTIYYEDSFVEYDNLRWQSENGGNAWEGEWVVDENPAKPIWSQDGTKQDKVQDEDRPGKYSLTDANNIYGYDSVNNNLSTYSLGSAMKATVNYDNAAQAGFTFYGTGFDVISMTSNTTGTIIVDVYPVNADDTLGEAVKSFVVDTYYGYMKDENDQWVVNPDAEGCLWQVPVMKVDGLTYGQYKVVIKAIYEPGFDHVGASVEGTYDFYLDAIRIYDPANDGASDGATDTTIEDAYKADGEGWPTYIELRNELIRANTLSYASATTKINGLVFIDGDAEVGDAQISDYVSYGPNNEVYLDAGQSVAFLFELPGNIANVHLGVKSADGTAGSYTIKNIAARDKNVDNITVSAGTAYHEKLVPITTTTDMYYDMTAWRNDIIVITNSGSGILSLTNVKVTYVSDPYATSDADATSGDAEGEEPAVGRIYMTAPAAMLTLRTLNAPAVQEPEVTEPEVTEPEVTEPEVTEPEVTEPEVTEPEVTEPEVTEPEVTEPEVTEPEEPKPEEPEQPSVNEIIKQIIEDIIKIIGDWFGKWF